MDFTANKLVLYMLIIASGIDFILPWPLFNQQKPASKVDHPPAKINDDTRFPRQVVQPTWLNIPRPRFIDPRVIVNPQALQEAALIRKTIATAVEQNTFAVNPDETDDDVITSQPLPSFEPSEEDFVPQETYPPSGLPPWVIRMRTMWRNWYQNLFRRFRPQN